MTSDKVNAKYPKKGLCVCSLAASSRNLNTTFDCDSFASKIEVFPLPWDPDLKLAVSQQGHPCQLQCSALEGQGLKRAQQPSLNSDQKSLFREGSMAVNSRSLRQLLHRENSQTL